LAWPSDSKPQLNFNKRGCAHPRFFVAADRYDVGMSPLTDAERIAAQTLTRLAIQEDLAGIGDVTSQATIPQHLIGAAVFVARKLGVIAGLPVAAIVFERFDPALKLETKVTDADVVNAGTDVAIVRGSIRSILAAERTALNFLQRLSGIATLTRRYVDLVAGRSKVLDTRKTTPGWRLLEKYAVRAGGGHNHRTGLFDAILIKDNHLAALGGGANVIERAVTAARRHSPNLPIEVEVDSLESCEAALRCGPDMILLDNMSTAEMCQCVERRNAIAKTILLEASGGVTLETIADIAATGVDRISVGALTHSAPALDIALDYQTELCVD
jgi:nicotinate-nucleotide pyrophosphorylase (carboxylating)